MHTLRLFLFAVAALPIAAQTYVVDVNNGPGTNFTTLQTAITTVPAGSTLLVRAGNYFESLDIDGKSLSRLG